MKQFRHQQQKENVSFNIRPLFSEAVGPYPCTNRSTIVPGSGSNSAGRHPSPELKSPSSYYKSVPNTARTKKRKAALSNQIAIEPFITEAAYSSVGARPKRSESQAKPHITFTWVRQELAEAWQRELELKQYVREYALRHNDKLSRHVILLEKQTG
jgi:hypothetical protein